MIDDDDKNTLDDEPELAALVTENAKLKHRLAILNRVSFICGFYLLFVYAASNNVYILYAGNRS